MLQRHLAVLVAIERKGAAEGCLAAALLYGLQSAVKLVGCKGSCCCCGQVVLRGLGGPAAALRQQFEPRSNWKLPLDVMLPGHATLRVPLIAVTIIVGLC